MSKNLLLLWYADPTPSQPLYFTFYIFIQFGNKMDIFKKVDKSFLMCKRRIYYSVDIPTLASHTSARNSVCPLEQL